MPAAFMFAQFASKYGSMYVPSSTRAMAKARPDPWTAFQAIEPWNWETSMPWRVLLPAQMTCACAASPTFSGGAPQPARSAAAIVVQARRVFIRARECTTRAAAETAQFSGAHAECDAAVAVISLRLAESRRGRRARGDRFDRDISDHVSSSPLETE